MAYNLLYYYVIYTPSVLFISWILYKYKIRVLDFLFMSFLTAKTIVKMIQPGPKKDFYVQHVRYTPEYMVIRYTFKGDSFCVVKNRPYNPTQPALVNEYETTDYTPREYILSANIDFTHDITSEMNMFLGSVVPHDNLTTRRLLEILRYGSDCCLQTVDERCNIIEYEPHAHVC